MLKKCSKCQLERETNFFKRDKAKFDGLYSSCRECVSKSRDKESAAIYRKKYDATHKEEKKARRRKNYLANRASENNYSKEYLSKNKEKINELRRIRFQTDIHYRIKLLCSSRIRHALKGLNKSANTISLLGCDKKFLIKHLESQFLNGMSWQNHSLLGWHIDHLIPCEAFNLENVEDQRKCFHYSNLMPRWATNDIAKKYGSNQLGNLNKSDEIFSNDIIYKK